MNMMDILQQAGGVEAIASELGVSPQMAQSGAGALLPAILGGFKRETQAQPQGLDGLIGSIGGMGGGGLLDAVLGNQPTPVDQGNQILGQIFGSKDVSRRVAGQAAEQSGVGSDLLKRMLPMLAMAVAGYLARQGGGDQEESSGGLGGALGNVLGGALGGGGSQSGGGLGSLLDLDGDGNPLDDILNMGRTLTGN